MRRVRVAPARRGVVDPVARESIDVDKPTTNWPSDSASGVRPDGSEARMSLEEMAAEALVVPDSKLPLDGEWRPEIAALQ